MESRPHVVRGVERLKGAFLEMPGTRLTMPDAARVSGLDHPVCEAVLGALEHARFLTRSDDGWYERRTIDFQSE